MPETINIVRDPTPWLQGGALGVLFAVIIVLVLCILVPIMGTVAWAIRYIFTNVGARLDSIGQRLDNLIGAIVDNTAAMREIADKQDVIIASLAAPEPPRPSSNGAAHVEPPDTPPVTPPDNPPQTEGR